jgi:hypothetical protein
MELSLQTRAFSRKWRIAIGSAAVLGIFLLIAYYSLKELQTYLIIVDPIPVSITLDGGPVKCAKFNSHCGFTVREIWGEHIIVVKFDDKSTVRVAVFPRLSDDNSSSLEITPTKVVSHGDLRLKVIHP